MVWEMLRKNVSFVGLFVCLFVCLFGCLCVCLFRVERMFQWGGLR